MDIRFKADPNIKAPLFCQYAGELQPQPAFIELNLEDGTLDADYSGVLGSGVPVKVFYGKIQRFSVPSDIAGKALESFIHEHAPLFERVCQGYEDVWDGNNYVARLTDDAQGAIEEIESAIERELHDEDKRISVASLDEYLAQPVQSIEDLWPEELAHDLDAAAQKLYDDVQSEISGENWQVEGKAMLTMHAPSSWNMHH
jgi:hypothetical protein